MLRPSFLSSPRQRAVGRNLALDMVAAIGVGVTAALVMTLLPDDRPARRPRADRARRPRRRTLLRQPAGRLRRTRGAALTAPARADPWRRRRRAPRARGRRGRPGDGRGLGRVLAQPLARRPVPPAPVGIDVPGTDPRARRRPARVGQVRGGRPGGDVRRPPGGPARRRGRGRTGRAGRTRLRGGLCRPAIPECGAAAGILGARLHPGAPRATGPRPDRLRPGVLRRRSDRRDAPLRDRQRRPTGPVALRSRDHRDHDRGGDHAVRSSCGARSATGTARWSRCGSGAPSACWP